MRWDKDPRIQKNIRGLIRYHKVDWVENSIHTLGLAYAFTGNEKYAQKAAVLLERLAEVYEGWIVHDWTHLYPADKPEGFAGKGSGWKIYDANMLRNAAVTYNYIYNSGVLSEDQKVKIEEKLFRVGADLLTALPPRTALANGAPKLLAGTAAIGRLLNDHDIIAYSVDGFNELLDEYFLEDGHWWEGAPSYALMTLNTFYIIPEILQGYSDLVSYSGDDAFQDLDLTGSPFIKRVFTALNNITFPDGSLPATNDSHVRAKVSPALAEALYTWYGGEDNLRHLIESYNGDLRTGGSEYALYKREPDIQTRLESGSTFAPKESHLAPAVGLGVLRAGAPSRQTVLMLDYGPHGGSHGHPDKLNILFWANSAELLMDLGYIHVGDPLMRWIRSSVSHNLVVVDLREQSQTTGTLRTFSVSPGVQLISADAPGAYQGVGVTLYNRTSALVGLPGDDIYAVDIFRVKGGKIHDWILHSPNRSNDTIFHGVSLAQGELPFNDVGRYSYIEETESGKASAPWGFTWEHWKMRVDLLEDEPMEVYTGTAPGQREFSGSDKGTRIKMIIGRRIGQDLTSQFISVLQPYDKAPFIDSMDTLTFTDSSQMRAGVQVNLSGRTDYIISTLEESSFQQHSIATDSHGLIDFKGEFGIASVKGDALNFLFLAKGRELSLVDYSIIGDEDLTDFWLKPCDSNVYEVSGKGSAKIKLPKASGQVGTVTNGKWEMIESVSTGDGHIVIPVSLNEGETVKIEFK